ncbi:hypothetical protein DPM19_30665 [Actinomadura craniellae]|uniref:Sulfotransferase n=1 Tax=Actinomadura craniellae TaxID=2231787 RepID=A0A365GX34_9ACTN|nr:sulfotransferase [Actinomadura craniellae]RAY11389.1 hypothetical protein DPM19_30665 [Actinomadura craniellae]
MLGFVLGSGRCGSTLVHEVLARHPEVGFLTNIDDRYARCPGAVRRHGGTLYRRLPPALSAKGRLRFAPSEGYRALTREVSPLLVDPFRDLVAGDATPWLAGRLRAFFEQRAAAAGAPVYLHKFTGWPRAGLLHEVFPGTRFVHVVRDGRAVAASWLRMPWWRGHLGPAGWHFGPLPEPYARQWEQSGRCHVQLAGIGWNMLMDAHEAARAALPADRWLEVRYEDVVADPAEHFTRMLRFFGLEPDRAFERGLARYTFATGRADAFRTDLSPAQVATLDKTLAPHLERLGYPV